VIVYESRPVEKKVTKKRLYGFEPLGSKPNRIAP
jgi:hypothetical protein